MAVNSNVGFKLGTQAAVDNIIKNNTAVSIGSFYLTSDTHRLYIGESDGLHPVNEGVITVDTINGLPDVSSNPGAYAGRFYYIKNDNILCVFNGSIWAQINSDTYVKKHEFVAVKVDGEENVIEIDGKIYNYTAGNVSHTSNAPFQIEGANGIVATVSKSQRTIGQETIDVYKITLTGDTYTIGTKANGSNAQIKLDSTNAKNNSLVEIVPDIHETEEETNVVLTVDEANKKIKLAVKDTKNKTLAITDEAEGFKVSLTDTYNKVLSAVLNPTVEYGVDDKDTATFKNGKVSLDVYSKSEIQDKLRALNAMTYRGTIGNGGSAATHIVTSGTAPNYTYKIMNGTTEIKVSLGDTFMVVGSDSVSLNNNASYLSSGSLLIVRGNAEGTDGYVTSPQFDVVESTVDWDTTYHFEGVPASDVTNGGGILLRDDTASKTIQGKFIVEGGTQSGGAKIEISRQTDKLATNGYQEKLTVKHGTVARTNTKNVDDSGVARGAIEMTPQEGNFGQEVTIPVVIGVTTDSTGHVTGVRTQDYTIEDTNAKMGKNQYDTSIYTKADGTHVGVIKSTVGVKSHLNATNELAGSMTLNSQSLVISNQDGNGATNGGTAVAGLQIEMVWGEFK